MKRANLAPDDVVGIVEHIERDQPTHHDHDDDDPEHDEYNLIEQPEKRQHGGCLVG